MYGRSLFCKRGPGGLFGCGKGQGFAVPALPDYCFILARMVYHYKRIMKPIFNKVAISSVRQLNYCRSLPAVTRLSGLSARLAIRPSDKSETDSNCHFRPGERPRVDGVSCFQDLCFCVSRPRRRPKLPSHKSQSGLPKAVCYAPFRGSSDMLRALRLWMACPVMPAPPPYTFIIATRALHYKLN
jgi:hypothetical protein